VESWEALNGYDRLATALEDAARELGGDFAALAKLVLPDRRGRWISTYGASSSRLARMELRSGLGVGGMAIRLGVPYQASAEKNAHMLGECPVMLAERLAAAIAIPLPAPANEYGSSVLVVGRREEAHSFEEIKIRQISSKMPLWIELSALWRYDGGKWNVMMNGGVG
jgi:nitrogen regulatory protein A